MDGRDDDGGGIDGMDGIDGIDELGGGIGGGIADRVDGPDRSGGTCCGGGGAWGGLGR
jgi:hypothetical protein